MMNDIAPDPSPTLATRLSVEGDIATLTFERPEKRNAMNDALVAGPDAFFSRPPEGVRAVILRGEDGHFCAGLDLSEPAHRSPSERVHHSRNWHRVSDLIEFGPLPVVSVLTGAVIGGGLEIAASTHDRIAEPSVRIQLPEGLRGIFVGGGAMVRLCRILGSDRMRELMLTGRSYGADEGLALGLAEYGVGAGEGLALAQTLARIGDIGRAEGPAPKASPLRRCGLRTARPRGCAPSFKSATRIPGRMRRRAGRGDARKARDR